MLGGMNYQMISEDDLKPVIEIGEGLISAVYYNDLSGEISIENEDYDQIFFRDDGKLKHHIEYLEEEIEALKKAYFNNMKVFKRAIFLLKKEQAKFKKAKK
jgi:hypothetical protein